MKKILTTIVMVLVALTILSSQIVTYNCTNKRDEWNRWASAKGTTISVNDSLRTIVVVEVENVTTLIRYNNRIKGINNETIYLWKNGACVTVPMEINGMYIISVYHEDFLCPIKKNDE